MNETDSHDARSVDTRPLARQSVRARWAVLGTTALYGCLWGLHVARAVTLAVGGHARPWSAATRATVHVLDAFLAGYPAMLAPIAALIVGAIFVGRWARAAYDRAGVVGAGKLRFTSDMAQWCFFIPVLNFWRPYQVFVELDRAADPADLPPVPAPVDPLHYRDPAAALAPPSTAFARAPVGAWWTCYVIGALVVRSVHNGASPTVAAVINADVVMASSDFLRGLAGVCLAVTIVRIQRRLDERTRRYAAAERAAKDLAAVAA